MVNDNQIIIWTQEKEYLKKLIKMELLTDKFVERVKYAEFAQMIKDYPLVDIFDKGLSIKYPDGSYEPTSFSVDIMALAQHYGIKTELIDVTVDKFVAAFFACTQYIDGHYETVKDNNS